MAYLVRHLVQEVRLIFSLIDSTPQLTARGVEINASATVMSCRDKISVEVLQCVVHEVFELDLAIARDIGVGSDTALIVEQCWLKHEVPVLFFQIDLKRRVRSDP